MAQHTQVSITDDIDGSEPARTYRFSWQDTQYEVDLNDTHRDELLRALQPYIAAGRRADGRRRAGAPSRGSGDTAVVRAWARANGYSVTDRGSIPDRIRAAYDNR